MVVTEYVSPVTGRKCRVVNVWSMVSRSLEEVFVEGEYYTEDIIRNVSEGRVYPYETVVSVYPGKVKGFFEVEESSLLQLDVVVFEGENDRRIYLEDGLIIWNKKLIK